MSIKSNFPSIRPTLNLDFANTKRLDPRITFSRASSATYVDANGVIQTAAANVPRFDHDPATGESLGLLIEESRTNLLTYSEQFDNAAWTKTNTTIAANAAVAPDGTNTADLIYPTANGSSANANRGLYAVSSSAAVTTIYAKAAGKTWLILWGAQGNTRAWFNLSSGTIGTVNGGITASITSLGNGWYRCVVVQTVTFYNFAVSVADTDGSESVTASGTNGIYIWGAQLEAGSFPTSYIPTTTATVTRSADVAQMTGTNFSSWYRQDEGTIFLRALSRAEQYLVEIPTGGNYHVVAINSARAQLATVNSTTQANIFSASNSYNLNVMNSVCAAFKQNSFAVCSNGTTVSTATSGTVPTVDLLNIGRRNNGQNYSCSTFARIAFYPARLTDAQLQNLTSA